MNRVKLFYDSADRLNRLEDRVNAWFAEMVNLAEVRSVRQNASGGFIYIIVHWEETKKG